MRVLHVVLSLARGGRRNAVYSLIEGLRNFGVESYVCCVDELECPPEEVEPSMDRVLVLGRRSLFDLAAFRRFRDFCRDQKIDVIHAHVVAGQFTAVLARYRLRRNALLMTFHRSLDTDSVTNVDRFRNFLTSLHCGAIVAGSEERRLYFMKRNFVPDHKMVRIPFGTDLTRFHPDPESRAAIRKELGVGPEVTLVGAIGHFGLEKGIDIAIQSFRALAGRRLPGPVALVIFGDGPRRPEIEKLAASVGDSPGVVRLAGFREDINRCMTAIDLLLHTPRLEAFGLVLIEAMATGLPIVASRVGGVPDLVRDGSTGFMAAPEQPEAIAGALERLLNDPTLIASMGAESRRVAIAEYGLDLYAKRHIQLYDRLLQD